jgi:hypothetical protein
MQGEELLFNRYDNKYRYLIVNDIGGAVIKQLPGFKVFANYPNGKDNYIDKFDISIGDKDEEIYLIKENK